LEDRVSIIRELAAGTAAALIDAMSADQQATLFRELPEAERARLLPALGRSAQDALTLILRYPPDKAGGIMTTEFLSVPPTWTVEETLGLIQRVGGAKETVYEIYVVDSTDGRLRQVVSLRELVLTDRAKPVSETGSRRKLITVDPDTDREDVARMIAKYDLLALPVVDQAGRILGIVTVDDVLDVMVAEQTEDVQRFGGLEALEGPYTDVGFGTMIRKRAGWLTALFVGEMFTATAMGRFEHEIERAVVLALFIPLIISSGGNSGSQATSLIIRALALGEVTSRDWWKVAARELPSGLALGAILGTVGAVRILLWQEMGWYDYGEHDRLIALTVGLALVGVVAFGAVIGSLLPFVLKHLGFDPASASAPFVATLVDVTGIVIYFTVAALVLQGTVL
jgi:magnesium transporter